MAFFFNFFYFFKMLLQVFTRICSAYVTCSFFDNLLNVVKLDDSLYVSLVMSLFE